MRLFKILTNINIPGLGHFANEDNAGVHKHDDLLPGHINYVIFNTLLNLGRNGDSFISDVVAHQMTLQMKEKLRQLHKSMLGVLRIMKNDRLEREQHMQHFSQDS